MIILCEPRVEFVNRPFITSNWLCRTLAFMRFAIKLDVLRSLRPIRGPRADFVSCIFCSVFFSRHFAIFIAIITATTKSLANKSCTWSKIEWEMVCYLPNSLALQNNPPSTAKTSAQIAFNRDWNFERKYLAREEKNERMKEREGQYARDKCNVKSFEGLKMNTYTGTKAHGRERALPTHTL